MSWVVRLPRAGVYERSYRARPKYATVQVGNGLESGCVIALASLCYLPVGTLVAVVSLALQILPALLALRSSASR